MLQNVHENHFADNIKDIQNSIENLKHQSESIRMGSSRTKVVKIKPVKLLLEITANGNVMFANTSP